MLLLMFADESILILHHTRTSRTVSKVAFLYVLTLIFHVGNFRAHKINVVSRQIEFAESIDYVA